MALLGRVLAVYCCKFSNTAFLYPMCGCDLDRGDQRLFWASLRCGLAVLLRCIPFRGAQKMPPILNSNALRTSYVLALI